MFLCFSVERDIGFFRNADYLTCPQSGETYGESDRKTYTSYRGLFLQNYVKPWNSSPKFQMPTGANRQVKSYLGCSLSQKTARCWQTTQHTRSRGQLAVATPCLQLEWNLAPLLAVHNISRPYEFGLNAESMGLGRQFKSATLALFRKTHLSNNARVCVRVHVGDL